MEAVPCVFPLAGLHDGRVRFQVSQTLDAIERRLTTDPLRATAVLDLAEIVHLVDLDAGKPANLLRLGLAVDAVTRHAGDDHEPLARHAVHAHRQRDGGRARTRVGEPGAVPGTGRYGRGERGRRLARAGRAAEAGAARPWHAPARSGN